MQGGHEIGRASHGVSPAKQLSGPSGIVHQHLHTRLSDWWTLSLQYSIQHSDALYGLKDLNHSDPGVVMRGLDAANCDDELVRM
jgi:hypothetical protein